MQVIKEVVSFNNKNVVLEAFWLKNLEGFFWKDESRFICVSHYKKNGVLRGRCPNR